MALVLDETFTTMPGSFATLRADGTAGTATHNPGAAAVDLVAGSSWLLYDITSQPVRPTGEVEVVIEMLADVSGNKHMGVWLFTGSGAISNGLRAIHYTTGASDQWLADWWNHASTFAGGQYESRVMDTANPSTLAVGGALRTIRVKWDTAATGLVFAQIYIDGVLAHSMSSYPPGQLRPGLGVYKSTMRLHSIKVWDALESPMDTASPRRSPMPRGAQLIALDTGVAIVPRRALPGLVKFPNPVPAMSGGAVPGFRPTPQSAKILMGPPQQYTGVWGRAEFSSYLGRKITANGQAVSSGTPMLVARYGVASRDYYLGGVGRIAGTVSEKSSPSNNPLSRKVVLVDEQNLLLVRVAWSDKLTGAYSFDYVNENHTYTVFAYDHTGSYRAVIANKQIPVIIQ